jgi:hypothetical protein
MVKYLVDALEPPAFKERVRSALALDSKKDANRRLEEFLGVCASRSMEGET